MNKSTAVSVLPFGIEDYDAVFTLWQQCEGVGLSGADSYESIVAYLERNSCMSFVAKNADAVVGAILCGHDGRRGYIHHLAVHQEFRLCGIGRRLVNHSLAALRAENIQKCHLFIFHENEPGIAFWQSIGWTFRQDIRVMSTQISDREN